jgi:hypothetical protein
MITQQRYWKLKEETRLLNSRRAAIRFCGQLTTYSLELDLMERDGIVAVIQLGEFD